MRAATTLAVTTSTLATTTTLVPGAHQDPADLWGILLAVAVIGGSILMVRLLFRSRR